MITGTLLRLLAAGGLMLLGVASFGGGTVSALGFVLLAVGFVWGTILLFVLSAQLFMYGITGIAHDIGLSQEDDPWNRW
ncbi:hypothetical protein BH20CHL7_BH20CHL7_16500 [soil metagenome]